MVKKKITQSLLIAFCLCFNILGLTPEQQAPKTALLLIDIQNFYFPAGALPLVKAEEASLNAGKLLKKFRQNKELIIHVAHKAKKGARIHNNVKPLPGEKIITKTEVNCFKNTALLEYLKKNQIRRLVICGMQTHMCLEAGVRAAHDYDFKCILVDDACATRPLKFKGKNISAEAVHNSTLATLKGTYARVLDTETYLKMQQ